MNLKIKGQRGVTLIALIIVVVTLIIISNIVIYNVRDNLKIESLKNMQNDIENLSDKVSTYYAQYGTIPKKNEYTNLEELRSTGIISDDVDKGKFYIIDLSALENLTLTYGEDYKKIDEGAINDLKDIYIINETSHNIFYVKGITIKEKTFYTNYTTEQVDIAEVNLRYVDNIKIPDGYSYIEGRINDETGIRIKNKSDETSIYKWIVQENKITDVPSGIAVDNIEDFIKSVNSYKGYYKSESDNTVIYLPIGENWSGTYDTKSIYKDENGDIAFIPKGFQVSKLQEENEVKKGLIIKNATTDDRYVWVEVPKKIYITAQSDTDYENIEKDMQSYTSEYRTNYSDNWYDGCGITDIIDYNNLKNRMLSSVYNNGGFWISQYEIGAISAVSTNDITRTPISKESQYPYNNVTCSQAQNLATNMDSGDFSSSLLFGIQWDLTLKYIEERSGKSQEEMQTNSSTWGNHSDSNFSIYKGKYTTTPETISSWTQVSLDFDKTSTTSALLTSGATERNKVQNIYDLAGNVCEWTLENSNSSNACVARGGTYTESGKLFSASGRLNNNNTYTDSSAGFRVALY